MASDAAVRRSDCGRHAHVFGSALKVMQRNRVLIAFGIAWLSALVLSWWLYRTSTAPQAPDVVRIVAAAKDLPIGKRLEASDLKMISVDRKDVPKGAILKTADIVD